MLLFRHPLCLGGLYGRGITVFRLAAFALADLVIKLRHLAVHLSRLHKNSPDLSERQRTYLPRSHVGLDSGSATYLPRGQTPCYIYPRADLDAILA